MNSQFIKQAIQQIDQLEVSSRQQAILYRLLEEDEEHKMEQLAMETLDEPNPRKRKKLFNSVKAELYRLLCTDENYYNPERHKAAGNVELLVPILAAAVGTAIGIEVALITGLVAALLMIILKLGRQAWCNANRP